MVRKLVTILASTIGARLNCIAAGNPWADKHEEILNDLVSSYLPCGSGFDCGTTLDLEASTGEKIVMGVSFHHMNDAGSYDGWTQHVVTIRPSLTFGFDVLVSGRDRNDIKSYITETFSHVLGLEMENDNVRGCYRRKTGDGSAEFPFAA